LRELIALEFPRLHVLSYSELVPDLNIQPIARIALSRS
jgi:type III secretory pathway component EscV